MNCYNCGAVLTEQDFCPNCGANVSIYKEIENLTNRLYNEGLQKAQVRDLSGACASLRQAIAADKYNVNARNLLGLCLYECGEISEALGEWVISLNLKPDNNIASSYMADVQKNRNRLESQGNAIKKYNIALGYCRNGSIDVAIIQLKKVLQLLPNFVKARNLLALLYLNAGDHKKAKKQLEKSLAIDCGNTDARRYLKEAEFGLSLDVTDVKEVPEEDAAAKASGGEIGSAAKKDTVKVMDKLSFPKAVLYLGAGLLLGTTLVGFLILPMRVRAVREELNEQYRTVAEQLDARTSRVTEQQQRMENLEEENAILSSKVAEYEAAGELSESEDALYVAARIYMDDPHSTSALAEQFARINVENEKAESFRTLYAKILTTNRSDIVSYYYSTAKRAMDGGRYDEAIANFRNAIRYGSATVDIHYEEAVFYLAESYYRQFLNAGASGASRYADNLEQAKKYYEKAIEISPKAEYSIDAKEKLGEVQALLYNMNEDPDDMVPDTKIEDEPSIEEGTEEGEG